MKMNMLIQQNARNVAFVHAARHADSLKEAAVFTIVFVSGWPFVVVLSIPSVPAPCFLAG
jgi:hypothetical protein